MKPIKPKKCKTCGSLFEPRASTQVVCSWQCASAFTAKEKEKRDRQEYRQKKQELKSRRDWLNDAQTAFNAYIRFRDDKLPCVSCGRHHTGQYHAGHYRSVAAASQLRFNEDNVHKQCMPCNTHKSGNAVEYRINLVKRIGLERVEALEADNEPRKWTIDELKELKQKYKDKLKELKRGNQERCYR